MTMLSWSTTKANILPTTFVLFAPYSVYLCLLSLSVCASLLLPHPISLSFSTPSIALSLQWCMCSLECISLPPSVFICREVYNNQWTTCFHTHWLAFESHGLYVLRVCVHAICINRDGNRCMCNNHIYLKYMFTQYARLIAIAFSLNVSSNRLDASVIVPRFHIKLRSVFPSREFEWIYYRINLICVSSTCGSSLKRWNMEIFARNWAIFLLWLHGIFIRNWATFFSAYMKSLYDIGGLCFHFQTKIGEYSSDYRKLSNF